MTNQEATNVLSQHSEHWKRLLTENICSKEDGLQTVEALEMAIKALEFAEWVSNEFSDVIKNDIGESE